MVKNTILSQFFKALANDDVRSLSSMHIPKSDVFYIQSKYKEDTDQDIELDRLERCMYLEGLLPYSDVLEPDRIRSWEKDYLQYDEDYSQT